MSDSLIDLLNSRFELYNQASFIENDPISIPHQYHNPLDIEFTALWTAILSWGQRPTIINKAKDLFSRMGESPYDFILNHKPKDRMRFDDFKHRTFLKEDTYNFLEFFQWYYRNHDGLENCFAEPNDLKEGIINFRSNFDKFIQVKSRTQKHISTPAKKSACKRLNMFLRWMVRKDKQGVDFGIWNRIDPSELFIPLDVHVARVARHMALLNRKQNDWVAVEELTSMLRQIDPSDPVKYDYALFGIGVMEKSNYQ